MQSALRKIEYKTAPKPSEKRVIRTQGNVTYISNDMAQKKKPAAIAKAQPEPKRGLASTLFVLIVAFGALTVLVSRYAAMCSIGTQNNSIKQNIEKTEAQIEELKLNIELRDNLQYVQDTAQENLGMTYPKAEQKIYVDMSG